MRINVIPVQKLADQHLIAEYREIKMLPKFFMRSLNSKNGIQESNISTEYTLNKGHGYFFYNKIQFVIDRFEELLKEMEHRGFKTNFNTLPLIDEIPQKYKNNYNVTKKDMDINIERILLRINDKPSWYKFKGKNQDWEKFYA